MESRDVYYASIAVETGLPLEPLAEHLRQNDDPSQGSWATPLTVTTLTALAKRNYENAAEILCDYIEWGQWWDWPLNDLLDLPGARLTQRIASAIEKHFPTDDDLDEAMGTWPADQFVRLSHVSSRIGASICKLSAKTNEDKPSGPTLLLPQELLDSANQENYRHLGKALAEIVRPADVDLLVSHVSLARPFAAHVALAGLAKIAPASLSEWLTGLWLAIPEISTNDLTQNLSRVILRRGVRGAILALPAERTLPLARNWITQQEAKKRQLAEDLLEKHAAPEDIPFLRQSLLHMLADDDAEWDCFLVRAFYNLPNAGTIPELIDIFYRFRFSTGRSYAARALQVTSPDFFTNTMAHECLWDCEERTRELGTVFAPLESPETIQRLRLLADDRFEAENSRHGAKARLDRMDSRSN